MNRLLPFIAITLLMAACSGNKEKPIEKPIVMINKDIHSFAEPENAAINHLDLDLNVDFDKKIISGTAILSIENKTSTSQLYLDTRDLTITGITLDDGEKTAYSLLDPVEYLGSKLTIAIKPETKKVNITYYHFSKRCSSAMVRSFANCRRKVPIFVYTIASNFSTYMDTVTR